MIIVSSQLCESLHPWRGYKLKICLKYHVAASNIANHDKRVTLIIMWINIDVTFAFGYNHRHPGELINTHNTAIKNYIFKSQHQPQTQHKNQ